MQSLSDLYLAGSRSFPCHLRPYDFFSAESKWPDTFCSRTAKCYLIALQVQMNVFIDGAVGAGEIKLYTLLMGMEINPGIVSVWRFLKGVTYHSATSVHKPEGIKVSR